MIFLLMSSYKEFLVNVIEAAVRGGCKNLNKVLKIPETRPAIFFLLLLSAVQHSIMSDMLMMVGCLG